MPDKYLLVKGCAGLGNRLLTMCSAIDYACATNRILSIDWADGLYGPRNENVFHKYFTIDDHVRTIKNVADKDANDHFLSVYPKTFQGNLTSNLYEFYQQITHPFFNRLPQNKIHFLKLNQLKGCWAIHFEHKKKQGVLSYLRKATDRTSFPLGSSLHYNLKENVVIFADYIGDGSLKNLRYLQLAPQLKDLIEDFSDKYQLTTAIGIHVRNTDLKPTRSIESLIKIIKGKFANRPVFLATDDFNVIQRFKNEFEKVIIQDKQLPDIKNNEGIHQWGQKNNDYTIADRVLKESIIDMYLLSKCEFLFYQGNSSFSTIVNALHDNKQKSINWLI